ncbi:XkdX family protein [Brevibacillus agri]|nr:XkdX family protein [Brevibacillus agri]MDR9504781.1 XkdX family protein [Brevibacillus agri]
MASRLYPYCLMRWESGAWGDEQLTTAVTKGYITGEEKTEIMAQPQQSA